jgi:hypothetical protein
VLNGRERTWRLSAVAVVLVLLLTGTLFGDDDEFPFGPFRMYSTTNRLDGRVTATRVEATTVHGDEVRFGAAQYGMRRAELEGQVPRIEREPELLGVLAATYRDLNPGTPEFSEVRVVRDVWKLENGQASGSSTEEVVVTWRPG